MKPRWDIRPGLERRLGRGRWKKGEAPSPSGSEARAPGKPQRPHIRHQVITCSDRPSSNGDLERGLPCASVSSSVGWEHCSTNVVGLLNTRVGRVYTLNGAWHSGWNIVRTK